MAKPKVISDSERKALLVLESDALREEIGVQCNDLAGPAAVLMQGVQMAQTGASLFGFMSPSRQSKQSNKLFSIPGAIFSFFKRH